MSVPDFTRAEYEQPTNVLDGERLHGRFAQAMVFGLIAMMVGAVGYAVVALSGFMVSIVAIGMAWLIAKAMMTATGGVGGRSYQIAAVVMTYFSVTLGQVFGMIHYLHGQGVAVAAMLSVYGPVLLKYLLIGPFLRGLSGIIGLVIVAIGMRYAWQMAAGTPGFSRAR